MSDLARPSTARTIALLGSWRAAWPHALEVWSSFTRLRDPHFCTSKIEAAQAGLSGSFAMIRLLDHRVVIDLDTVGALGLGDYALEILAHEIGHHLFVPANASEHFRLLARMRRALPTLEHHAAMVGNMYSDLFINDRLQRQAGLRMADIFRRLSDSSVSSVTPRKNTAWVLYLRIYEHLWQLDKGSLSGSEEPEGVDADAWLGARLVRVYAGDWMAGAGRFATLMLRYLADDEKASRALPHYLFDTRKAAEGCDTYGAQVVESDEIDGAVHPAYDERVTGEACAAPALEQATTQATGQMREPAEFGGILKAAGISLSDHDIAVRYYRERALPHLVPFPVKRAPRRQEPQFAGWEPWEIGDSLDELDWLQSLIQCPRPVPGLTTVRRTVECEGGPLEVDTPFDLAMYVDSSGSMPNPQTTTSFLALAGAIIALSALRAGSLVHVTLWSGKSEIQQTKGFVRDSDDILRVLTGFYGGATHFPINDLRERFCGTVPPARPTHILMISDDGITTMFDADEHGNSGWDVAARSLAAGGAGGTMALNLPADWEQVHGQPDAGNVSRDLVRAREEQGWKIHAIAKHADLLDFARAFSRRHFVARQFSLKDRP